MVLLISPPLLWYTSIAAWSRVAEGASAPPKNHKKYTRNTIKKCSHKRSALGLAPAPVWPTCLLMIFSSRLSQSILSSVMGSWMAQRSYSSVTFFSSRPAWWFRRSISIWSWYASPLNSWNTTPHKGLSREPVNITTGLWSGKNKTSDPSSLSQWGSAHW